MTIRHCTLVPGWSTGGDCGPENRGEPSLELVDTGARVTVERSILGGILVNQNEVDTEPITVELRDSILDATGPDHDALAGPNGRYAHAVAGIVRCTVFGPRAGARHRAGRGHDLRRPRPGRPPPGRLHAVLLRPAGLPYSRRYLCQPYLVVTAVRRRFEAGELTAAERAAERSRRRCGCGRASRASVYSTPTYARLGPTCAPEISAGAHDESEMGAYHDLFQPQHAASLQARLDEHIPAGTSAGIVNVI